MMILPKNDTLLHIIPNLYEFLSSVFNRRRYLKNAGKTATVNIDFSGY